MKKTISVWELPENQVYIDLSGNCKRKLLSLLFKIDSRKTTLERLLDERPHSLDSFLRFMKPLSFVKKIINLLRKNGYNISLKYIEKNITKVRTCHSANAKRSTILNPMLPINFFSVDAAQLTMAILCDGWISAALRAGYSNKDKGLRVSTYNLVKNVFGEINTTIGKKEFKIPKICTLFLIRGINLPLGRKTKTNPSFPKFFVDSGDENIIKASLRQAFDDEGYAHYDKKKHDRAVVIKFSIDVTNLPKSKRMKILRKNDTKYAPNLIKDIKKMLHKIGIDSTLRPIKREFKTKNNEVHHKWLLIISGRKNLEKYMKKVGFSLKAKNKKLEEMVKSYERRQCRYNESLKKAKEAIRDIEGPITSKGLANTLNRTPEYCKELLNRLECINYIKKIKEYGGFHSRPAVYEVID